MAGRFCLSTVSSSRPEMIRRFVRASVSMALTRSECTGNLPKSWMRISRGGVLGDRARLATQPPHTSTMRIGSQMTATRAQGPVAIGAGVRTGGAGERDLFCGDCLPRPFFSARLEVGAGCPPCPAPGSATAVATTGAVLTGAVLTGAVLTGTAPIGAVLTGDLPPGAGLSVESRVKNRVSVSKK